MRKSEGRIYEGLSCTRPAAVDKVAIWVLSCRSLVRRRVVGDGDWPTLEYSGQTKSGVSSLLACLSLDTKESAVEAGITKSHPRSCTHCAPAVGEADAQAPTKHPPSIHQTPPTAGRMQPCRPWHAGAACLGNTFWEGQSRGTPPEVPGTPCSDLERRDSSPTRNANFTPSLVHVAGPSGHGAISPSDLLPAMAIISNASFPE